MVNPFSNSSYLLSPLVALVVSFILIIVVLSWGRRGFNSWIFCGLLLSVGLWGFLMFGMRSSPDVPHAVVWNRVATVPAIATFVLYYHFTLTYTNAKGQKGFLLASYLLLAIVIALISTDLIVKNVHVEDYGYAPVQGPLSLPLSIATLPLLGGGVYNLLRRYKASTSYEERNRLLYLVIAILFPVLGAFLDAFTNLPPALIWSQMVFYIVCSIAILKYHLLDIRIVLRKSLVYLFISAMVAIPYVTVLLSVSRALNTTIEPWWMHVLLILFLAIILQPLHGWAQNVVDRLFYRERYDYLKALEQFSQKAQSVVNLKELSSTLTRLVSGALRTSSACLLLPSESDNGLIVVSSTGLGSPPSGVVLRNSSPLVTWLKLQQRILSSEEFNIVPQLQRLSLREKNNLEQMEAKLCVPIQTGPGQLSGILVLGQKLSQQIYSSEDRQLLTALGSQMAIALENARLYNDALRARENLETWLNSMGDCVIIVSTDYTIQFMNKAAIEQFGANGGGICWNALGKDARCPDCPIQRYLRGNKEGYHYVSDIGDREYDVAAAPLSNPDGSLSIIEVLRDITERKQAEEREKELQQELYLSSRLAAIGELAAGVAHEINNPLTGVLGFSQRLLRKSTDQEVSRDLERIHNEALRAAKVVQNLLTFARRREPKKQYSDINDIVQKALELRAYELKTGNIEVITDLTPNLPQVVVDLHQIQEVFLNIILNAEQAVTGVKGGGKLSIKTQQIKKHIRISFSDDGPGVPAQHLDKLFDPFFTTRGEMGGTGLGLSICHGIVAEHGGRIYVKSKPEKGATFFVELPIMSETVAESRGVKEEAISRSK